MIIRIKKTNLSSVTKRVIKDFNNLSDQSFLNKYSCTKRKYLKRLIKYGDPYTNSPLSKIGKLLTRLF